MRKKRSKEKILLWALSLTILIDFMNGFFKGFHIGEVYRVLLLFYCGSIIISDRKRDAFWFFMAILFLSINIFVSFLREQSYNALRTDISMGLKTLMFYTISSSILILFRKGRFKKETIDNIIRINIIYTPVLFALSSIMGGGNAGYSWAGETIGSKSEFLSLNSINSAMMLMYMYCTYHIFSKKRKIWIIGALYIAIPMLTLGTKTSIAMVIATPVIFALLRIRKKRTIITIFALTALLIIVLPRIWPFIMNKLEGILARQSFLFKHRSFISYLTSTRSDRVAIIWEYYLQNFNVLDIFPGSGYHYTHHIVAQLMDFTEDVIPIEMDWIDILTAYGIGGFFYTYFYAIKTLFTYRKNRKDDDCKMYFWITVILIAYGTFAGHIFTEAISSTFLSLGFCGYCLSINNSKSFFNKVYDKQQKNILRINNTKRT